MTKSICIVCGEGGHAEQGKRLSDLLKPFDLEIFQVGDVNKLIFPGLNIGEIRDKSSGSIINPIKALKQMILISRFLKKNRITEVISLGPGLAVIVAISCTFLRIKFLHIESWSRFSEMSITSKILLRMGCEVWIQNQELKSTNEGKNLFLIGRL